MKQNNLFDNNLNRFNYYRERVEIQKELQTIIK